MYRKLDLDLLGFEEVSCGSFPFDILDDGDLLLLVVEVGLGSCEYGGVAATGMDPFLTGLDGFLLTAGLK